MLDAFLSRLGPASTFAFYLLLAILFTFELSLLLDLRMLDDSTLKHDTPKMYEVLILFKLLFLKAS